VPDAYVRLAVGAIAVVFTLIHWFARRRPPPRAGRPPVAKGVFWGAVSGFTTFLAHSGAPPFQFFVLPQKLPTQTFVGTLSIFFAVANMLKIGPYLALGQLTFTHLATSLVLLPLAVATNLLGVWLVRRTPQALFYRIAYLLIFIVGLELIREGVLAISRGGSAT
ncbi:MAG: sulfite exporter TauE/SafE family protein, partial [Proteobacteria bacterium]|nr:sulfite exporter TauE/SafE family protein [Pseudomonadota bacterium]